MCWGPSWQLMTSMLCNMADSWSRELSFRQGCWWTLCNNNAQTILLCILFGSLASSPYVWPKYKAPEIYMMFDGFYYMFNLPMINMCQNLGAINCPQTLCNVQEHIGCVIDLVCKLVFCPLCVHICMRHIHVSVSGIYYHILCTTIVVLYDIFKMLY
jgi:hypothetical protein